MDKIRKILEQQDALRDQPYLKIEIRNQVIKKIISRRLQKKKRLQIASQLFLLLMLWLLITFFIVFSDTVFKISLSEAYTLIGLVFAVSLILLGNFFQKLVLFLKLLPPGVYKQR